MNLPFKSWLLTIAITTSLSIGTVHANANNTLAVDGIVALVNDTPILYSQLQEAIEITTAQLQAQGMTVPNAEQMSAKVLSDQIMQRVQLDVAKRLGIAVSDEQIQQAMLNLAKESGVNNLAELQKLLDNEKTGSYQALRQRMIDNLTIQILQQQQLARRVRISEQDVDLFLQSPESRGLQQNSYRTLHIRIPYPNNTLNDHHRQQATTAAQKVIDGLQKNLSYQQVIQNAQQGYPAEIQGGDMGYHETSNLPTEIAKDILALKIGQISPPLIHKDGIDVIQLLDIKESNRILLPQWSIRHILISPSAKLSDDMAKQKIENIYLQLQQGADFATLATTYSNDTGSAKNGGSLGWTNEGMMVAEFEQMMKNTEVNDFSTPFQTQFGWHILKVEDKRQQDVTELYHRNRAKELLYQRLSPQVLEDWLQEIRSQAYIKIHS